MPGASFTLAVYVGRRVLTGRIPEDATGLPGASLTLAVYLGRRFLTGWIPEDATGLPGASFTLAVYVGELAHTPSVFFGRLPAAGGQATEKEGVGSAGGL